MRYRFEVDYESETEWGVGILAHLIDAPGREVSGSELASVLRALADQVETWPEDHVLAINYPRPVVVTA